MVIRMDLIHLLTNETNETYSKQGEYLYSTFWDVSFDFFHLATCGANDNVCMTRPYEIALYSWT